MMMTMQESNYTTMATIVSEKGESNDNNHMQKGESNGNVVEKILNPQP
jgi:hypothetical protein